MGDWTPWGPALSPHLSLSHSFAQPARPTAKIASSRKPVLQVCSVHYSQIKYLQIHLLATVYLSPPKSIVVVLSQSLKNMWKSSSFPGKVKLGNALPSSFSSHTISRWPFGHIFDALLHIGAFCWWFGCLKWPPTMVLKCWWEFQSISKRWCLTERMHVSDDLRSDVSCNATGCEISVDESTMHIK